MVVSVRDSNRDPLIILSAKTMYMSRKSFLEEKTCTGLSSWRARVPSVAIEHKVSGHLS